MLEINAQRSCRGCSVLRPVGELDGVSVSYFRKALAEMAGSRETVIDLSEVPCLDSVGLGALIGAIRRTRERGGQVAIACSRPRALRLFHATGMERLVILSASVEEAATALSGAQLSLTGTRSRSLASC